MKLRLYISKKDDMKDYSQGRYIRFAVIDLDKSRSYPANYVCMLPQQPRANGKSHNVFSNLFGNDSLELAKRLLSKALKTSGIQLPDRQLRRGRPERREHLQPPLGGGSDDVEGVSSSSLVWGR